MKITSVEIRNYRTLEEVSLNLDSDYIAISGKNNSGKSNIFRMLASIFGSGQRMFFTEDTPMRFGADFPNWKSSASESIVCYVSIDVDRVKDAGLYRYISEFVINETAERSCFSITIGQNWKDHATDPELSLAVDGKGVEDMYIVSEFHKKIRSSRCVILHNSTDPSPDLYFGRSRWIVEGLAQTDTEKIKSASEKLRAAMQKSMAEHESEVYDLLGRLSEKYKVTLSPPNFDFADLPVRISLGDKQKVVPLDDWGSGTRNRTMILLNLLKARRSRDLPNESDRITPVILLEEAECFLHPSAQAEFGSRHELRLSTYSEREYRFQG